MSVTFAELGVPSFICNALERRGITEPFEIQAATIADSLAGRDVCGRAPTGSGKTLAFGIPLVAAANQAAPRRPHALVLAPTRELAEQIATELRSFSGNVRIGVVYGGVGYKPQLRSLNQGVDILVACPGRLEDLLSQGSLSLEDVDQVVLDEADRMADMGFIPAVRRLLDQTQSDRQTVLFSATLDGDVAKLTRDYQTDPVRHEVGEETPDITSASHCFWGVARDDRRQVTAEAINAVWPAIVFTRTRHGADRLAKQLGKDGVKAAAIHGGRSQNQRTRALNEFSKNKVHALIATDVAARGIHVDGVALVVHFDPPEDHKTYVHRSGRTARAGEGGVVVSLLERNQVRDAKKMMRQIGLDEPVGDPDPGALRDLSPAPTKTITPDDGGDDRDNRSGGGRSRDEGRPARNRNRNRNGGGRHEQRSGDGRRSESKSGGRPSRNRSDRNERSEGGERSERSERGERDGETRTAAGRGQSSGPKRNGRSSAKAGGSRPGGAKRKGAGKGSSNGASGKPAGKGSSKGSSKRNGSGGQASTKPGGNRKARRAHLQTGNNR